MTLKQRFRLCMVLVVGMGGLGLAGCQNGAGALEGPSAQAFAQVGDSDGDLQVVADLPPPPDAAGGQVRIAKNDILQVDVFGVDELDRSARVDGLGNIRMPLIGEVPAAGLTLTELEDVLEARYAVNLLQSPDITVFLEESFGQRVTIDGEFRRPGVISVTSQTTLLQIVARAGGVTGIANPKRIFVFRDMGHGQLVASYSLVAIRQGDARDPRIYGGDVVIAFPSGSRVAARNLREALGLVRSTTTAVPGI